MTVWIKGDIRLTDALRFDKPDENVVVLGRLASTCDITIIAKNLVVFGELFSSAAVAIKTENDFFSSGRVIANKVSIVADNNIYNGLDSTAVERIRRLGIDVLITATGTLQVRAPVVDS